MTRHALTGEKITTWICAGPIGDTWHFCVNENVDRVMHADTKNYGGMISYTANRITIVYLCSQLSDAYLKERYHTHTTEEAQLENHQQLFSWIYIIDGNCFKIEAQLKPAFA